MSLIDLYVAEVGKRLPLRSRKDIQAELRSTLQDMLDDRSQKAGRPADEAMESELLKEYGSPEKVAATYHRTQYLIGPRLYPFFVRVLQIVISVLSIVLLVTLGVKLGSQPLTGMDLARAIGEGLANILGGAIGAFGNIALVFAVLERVLPPSEQESFKDGQAVEWDPASLKQEAAKPEVRLWEPITRILFTVAALVIFNFYPQIVAVGFLRSGQWVSIPVLTEAFFRWLPFMNILWVLQIGLNLVLLRQMRWQPVTRWANIAIELAGIGIGLGLLGGPAVVSLSQAALQSTGLFDTVQAVSLSAIIAAAARLVIALIVVLQGAEVVKDVIRIIRKQL